ncbi:MAG: hypothetical protein HUJ30_02455 [Gammaproteobacteria bacterium]|nr:hypothetical protein [Gammaproteobacteria bacterium]
MGNSVETLTIRFETDNAGKVKASVVGLENGIEKIDDKTKKAAGSMNLLKTAIAAVGSAAAVGYVVQTASAYETLNARLITATGSQEAANSTFEYLRNLAAGMPAQVEELTDAYIKLANLGLEPSRQALISYGNTAAAQGKELNQLIEAVADAATGEFERLKEFGIKTRVEGDRVKFIFQGMTTEVANSSQAIQDYLINIGNTEYAGAMDLQNNTLKSSFADLADTISTATAKLAEETGFTQALKDAARGTAEAIRYLTNTETIVDVTNQMKDLNTSLVEYQLKLNKAREEGNRSQVSHYQFMITNTTSELQGLSLRYQHLTKLEEQYKKTNNARDGGGDGGKAQLDKELQTYQNNLRKKYDALQRSLMDEIALIKYNELEKLWIVEQMAELDANNTQKYADLRVAIEKEAAEKIAKIYKQMHDENKKASDDAFASLQTKIQQGLGIVAGAFGTYGSAMFTAAQNNADALDALADAAEANGSANAGALRAQAEAAEQAARRAFEQNKRLQKANVVINTAGAIMGAWNTYKGNAVAAGVATALIAAAGAAQLKAIDSASYGGSGSIPAPAGGYSPGNPGGTDSYIPGNDSGAGGTTVVFEIDTVYGMDDWDNKFEETAGRLQDLDRLNISEAA